MRGLIIHKHWLELTLDGKKSFEIRTKNSKSCERFGLICAGTGEVWGEARLLFARKETREKALTLGGKCYTKALQEFINTQLKGRPHVYIWYFDNIVRYDKPKPYKHPQGAQTWIREIEFKEEIS